MINKELAKKGRVVIWSGPAPLVRDTGKEGDITASGILPGE